MGVRLYPPLLEGTLPAFYLDSAEEGKGCGIMRIPFSYNRAINIQEVSESAEIKFKTVQNDAILGVTFGRLKKEEQVIEVEIKNNFDVNTGKINFVIGNYYKVQIAFINKQGNTVGYYSTVGVIKCTAKPTVTIDQLVEDTVNSNLYSFTGIYQCPNDINEKIYSSYFEIKNLNKEVIYRSEEALSSYQYQDTDFVSVSSLNYNKDLPKNEVCTITYNIKTINGLEMSSPIYRIMQRKLIPMDFQGSLIAVADAEDGYVDISMKGAIKDGIQEIAFGKFVLIREDSLYPGEWVELTRFKLNYEYPTKNIFRDFTVEHGKTYTYALQQFNDNNVYSDRKKSNLVHIEFEDMFLYDGQKQLKIKFNPQVSSFKLQVSESKNDTIGSKYPFFHRNAKIGYKTFPVSGLISMQMDDNEFFLTYNEIAREDLHGHRYDSLKDKFTNPNTYKHTDLLDQNFVSERLFKMKVLEWLNDGHVKLFKSPGEGNYLVRLMETSLSPNTTVGRMLHTFNSTAYECASIEYLDLVKYGIIADTSKLTVELNSFLQWQEDTFYQVSFSDLKNEDGSAKTDEYGNVIYSDYSTNLLERDGIVQATNIIRLMDLLPGTEVIFVFDESGGRNVDEENVVTWSPVRMISKEDPETGKIIEEDEFKDKKVSIMIGSTGNYYADNVKPIYGIYIKNSHNTNRYYPSNNVHFSYAIEGTVNTKFSMIKDIKASDNNLIQFVGSKNYKLIKSNSSFKDSIPYVNFVNLYKRPVEYLYYDPNDIDIITSYTGWNIFKRWKAVHNDLTKYPLHQVYDEKGYREISQYVQNSELKLYWDPQCTDLFNDEESQEYSPFSIYVVRPAQFNGVSVLDHLVEAAEIIDRNDGHQDSHWFEEYYIDRLAKAYTAEDYLAYCTSAVRYFQDNYAGKNLTKRNYISNGNFEYGISLKDNKFDRLNGESYIIYKNLWRCWGWGLDSISQSAYNFSVNPNNYWETSFKNPDAKTEFIFHLEKYQKTNDSFLKQYGYEKGLPILEKLNQGDTLRIAYDIYVDGADKYQIINTASINYSLENDPANTLHKAFSSFNVTKKSRWVHVEFTLNVDSNWDLNSDNVVELYLDIEPTLKIITDNGTPENETDDVEPYSDENIVLRIRNIKLYLEPAGEGYDLNYQISEEVAILDAWTGELKTIEAFNYNPSAYIDYIKPGLDDSKNKIDLREIEVYSIPDFIPDEDIEDIQIGNGVYGDFCCQKNTTIYDIEEDVDKWRAAKELRKVDLNLWRIDEDENPYWEDDKEVGKNELLARTEIKDRLHAYLNTRFWEQVNNEWMSSNRYWMEGFSVDDFETVEAANVIDEVTGKYRGKNVQTQKSNFIDWSFGEYKRILDAEDYAYQEYNKLLKEEIDDLVNPKADPSVVVDK